MLLQASTTSPQYQVAEPALQFPWFGIRTRSNFEKTTSAFLASKGYQQYLPLYVQRRQWSDRAVDTRLPLFPGYVFCRFDPKCRTPILSTPGVFAIVGFGNEPAPIPDEEIDAIETVLKFGRAPSRARSCAKGNACASRAARSKVSKEFKKKEERLTNRRFRYHAAALGCRRN